MARKQTVIFFITAIVILGLSSYLLTRYFARNQQYVPALDKPLSTSQTVRSHEPQLKTEDALLPFQSITLDEISSIFNGFHHPAALQLDPKLLRSLDQSVFERATWNLSQSDDAYAFESSNANEFYFNKVRPRDYAIAPGAINTARKMEPLISRLGFSDTPYSYRRSSLAEAFPGSEANLSGMPDSAAKQLRDKFEKPVDIVTVYALVKWAVAAPTYHELVTTYVHDPDEPKSGFFKFREESRQVGDDPNLTIPEFIRDPIAAMNHNG